VIGNVTISDNPLGGAGNANVFYSSNANLITTVNIDSFISNNNVTYGNATPFFSFPITFPANATYDRALVNIVNTGTANSNTRNTVTEIVYPPSGSRYFDNNNAVIFTRPLNNYVAAGSAPTTQYLKFDVKLEESVSKVTSRTANTANIPVAVQNTVPPILLAPLTSGSFILNSPPDKYISSPGTSNANIMSSPDIYTLTNAHEGEHFVFGSCYFVGAYTAGTVLNTNFAIKVDVEYANTVVQTVLDEWAKNYQLSTIPAVLGNKFTIPTGSNPVEMRVMLYGYSDVPLVDANGQRGFYNMFYQIIKPNKGVI
jgi:hypothetical protein